MDEEEEFHSFLFSEFVPMFRKAVLQNAGKTTDLNLMYCGNKFWRRQAYHQDLRPGVYTLSRVRQTIVEKVYLFLFSDCVQEWTFLKHRKRNRALYNMAVIYLEVPVLRTLKYYQPYDFMCIFLWKDSPHRTVDLIRSCARAFDDSSDAKSIQNWFQLWNKSKAARAKKRFYNLILNKVTGLNGCKIKLLLETKKRKKGFEGLNEECISQLGLTHNSPHQLLYAFLALM